MYFPLMLLKVAKAPFSSNEFIFEKKYDGIRIEYSNVNNLKLYTRNQNYANKQFPELLLDPLDEIVLDGEVIVAQGDIEDFEAVIRRFFSKKESVISSQIIANPVIYKVFDVLYYKGEDLRNKSLMERKEVLSNITINNPHIQKVDYTDTNGEDFFNYAKDNSYEGIVAKKKNSRYVGDRSDKWLKIINWIETDAIIIGYRKNDNAILCNHINGNLIGLVMSGMNSVQREAFLNIAKKITIKEDSEYYYLEPLLKCRLKGRAFTSNGALRSPIFLDFILH